MKTNFKVGEHVFMTAGNSVMEARVECPRYGRYVVAYRGSGYETEGRICVNGSRLFHSYDEAVARIRKSLAAESAIRTAAGQPVQRQRVSFRADEPGDGWARR